jgi:hypothetical protein
MSQPISPLLGKLPVDCSDDSSPSLLLPTLPTLPSNDRDATHTYDASMEQAAREPFPSSQLVMNPSATEQAARAHFFSATLLQDCPIPASNDGITSIGASTPTSLCTKLQPPTPTGTELPHDSSLQILPDELGQLVRQAHD